MHHSSALATPMKKYVNMVAARKGKNVKSSDGTVAGYLDENGPTVRSSKCDILTTGSKCDECIAYRDTLRVLPF